MLYLALSSNRIVNVPTFKANDITSEDTIDDAPDAAAEPFRGNLRRVRERKETQIRRRSVAIELRQRAQAEAKRAALEKVKMVILRFLVGFFAVLALFLVVATDVLAKDSVIEEVHSGQLEKLLQKKDFVAVFWYARNCKLCEEALDDLESIDDDAERFSVDFVKINDKRLAKSHGIKHFPALTFFRDGELTVFEGDITDEDEVLDFLTSEHLLFIPDKIEDVSAETLENMVREDLYVAALFYDDGKDSDEVLDELENIDDEAEVFNIRFVKIQDDYLTEEYSLGKLPALVYFRKKIPVVYFGDLMDETEVLEWLIQHQSSVDDEDSVESVTNAKLDIMIKNVDHLLVLFHDNKRPSVSALEALENIDDDCDHLGVSFVEVSDTKVAKSHGIKHFPTLVYFEHSFPSVFDDDLTDHELVLAWLTGMVEGADIEEVKDDMLDRMIVREDKIAVLFYHEGDDSSTHVLHALESIDDDLDLAEVRFVKNDEPKVAAEYGIENTPALVIFKRGVPSIYEGQLAEEAAVLEWIVDEITGEDKVEFITDAMLDQLVEKRKHVAVFFFDRDDPASEKALDILETIDDKIGRNPDMELVKIADKDEALEYGLETLPALLFFDEGFPCLYQGSFNNPNELLAWLNVALKEDMIGEVNAKMVDKLLEEDPEHLHGNHILVYIYFPSLSHDLRILRDLETIDDDLEEVNVHLMRLPDDGSFAAKYKVDLLPALVLFRDGVPMVFGGEISAEHEVFEWVKKVLKN